MLKKLFLLSWFIGTCAAAQEIVSSHQLLLVQTKNQQAVQGSLQRYQRTTLLQPWQAVGHAIPVVIGKQGKSLAKREGDLRTPIGTFMLGTKFGFSPSTDLSYIKLTATTYCIDDVHSRYYNQIIDTATIQKPDWQSGEKMRSVPGYQSGALIIYNSQRIPGKGSCIFLHIWKSPTQGTAGCIAMDKKNLTTVLNWLKPDKKPMISIR